MGLKVTYVVKGGPVFNDATIEDVIFSGMDKIADRITTTGADAVGIRSRKFLRNFFKLTKKRSLFSPKEWATLKP